MRSKRTLACGFLVALLLAPACGDPPGPDPKAVVRTGTAAGVAWALMPVEAGSAFGLDAGSFWMPDAEIVTKALAGVGAHLQTQAAEDERAPGVAARLGEYRCQAIGVVLEGQRRVYLNFVHANVVEGMIQDEKIDWTEKPIVVLDGGDLFWTVQFDPARGTFDELTINGES